MVGAYEQVDFDPSGAASARVAGWVVEHAARSSPATRTRSAQVTIPAPTTSRIDALVVPMAYDGNTVGGLARSCIDQLTRRMCVYR
jgi:hypothetical protein